MRELAGRADLSDADAVAAAGALLQGAEMGARRHGWEQVAEGIREALVAFGQETDWAPQDVLPTAPEAGGR